MPLFSYIPPHLLIVYGAYFIGTVSPGPSNLAIMGVAMNAGRVPAVIFAAGVLTGSVFWSLLVSLGLSAMLARFSEALVAMKILGGLYLLWLAAKSAGSAISKSTVVEPGMMPNPASHYRTFLSGTAMHLTNPKAIFVWLSIVTLALPAKARFGDTLLVISGCWAIGASVFGGYALAFSTPYARAAYQRLQRWLDGSLAVMFGYAGIRMLLSKGAST